MHSLLLSSLRSFGLLLVWLTLWAWAVNHDIDEAGYLMDITLNEDRTPNIDHCRSNVQFADSLVGESLAYIRQQTTVYFGDWHEFSYQPKTKSMSAKLPVRRPWGWGWTSSKHCTLSFQDQQLVLTVDQWHWKCYYDVTIGGSVLGVKGMGKVDEAGLMKVETTEDSGRCTSSLSDYLTDRPFIRSNNTVFLGSDRVTVEGHSVDGWDAAFETRADTHHKFHLKVDEKGRLMATTGGAYCRHLGKEAHVIVKAGSVMGVKPTGKEEIKDAKRERRMLRA